MKTLTGHLTATDKKVIKAMLDAKIMAGKVGKKNYFLSLENDTYTVKIQQKDRGLIPVVGSELRISTYTSTFSL